MNLPPAAELVALFRRRFANDARAAFRDWFVLQEHLRDDRESQEASEETARALASDLWSIRGTLVFSSKGEEATFLHNLAVFFGSRGPAESLERSLSLFEESLDAGYGSSDLEAWARLFHNRGNALQNLALSNEDLRESLASYERALSVRDASRRIARGVTLHARGLLFRKLAEAEPRLRLQHLSSAVSSFEESLLLRSEQNLERGMAETASALADARRALASGC
jgi:tetratricopeptide (TPR) repeat protein